MSLTARDNVLQQNQAWAKAGLTKVHQIHLQPCLFSNIHFSPCQFAVLEWFEDVGVCAYSTGIIRNELICGCASVVHTLMFILYTRTHTHTHTHTFSCHLRNANRWGLKVDIATSSCCFPFNHHMMQIISVLIRHWCVVHIYIVPEEFSL